jgi:hypothetical protein
MLEALVLAAEALVVLDRPEDLGTEKAVALGLEGAVVDGLGLLDFTVGPGTDLVREARPMVIASNSSSAARFCLNRSANRLFMCNFS